MAEHRQPLPSLARVLATAKLIPVRDWNHPLDPNGLQRGNHDGEDRGGEDRDAEEDAQTTCELHKHLHSHGEARAGGMPLSSFSSAATSAGPVCLVSFTGFRDEDVWRENDDEGDGAQHGPLVHAAGDHATPNANLLFVCEKMVSALPGVRVESKLTSSTSVLVARRGFTKKRLLAARQGIPVVLPRWVEKGCPMLPIVGGACGAIAAVSASSYDQYAVPWLHGYVFCATGLSTSEKAAIESVCAAHGAVLESSLTYKCDVLLTSAECIQALQRLLNADRAGNAARRRCNQHLHDAEAQCPGTGLMERPGAEMTTSHYGSDPSYTAWLTDKVRFALELDVPVVDYVKLFTMLRLHRLPPPTWTHGTVAPLPKSRLKTHQLFDDDVEDSKRQYADALSGSDFDAIVDVCRVGAPAGGSPEWARILSVFTMVGEAPTGGTVDMGSPTPLDGIALRDRSLQSSSSSLTDSASTVSDPDAWEALLSGALASSLGERQLQRADARPGASGTTGTNHAADHVNGITSTATVSSPSRSVLDRLTVNTADVEDLAIAGEEPSTLHVSFPDYYSATVGPRLSPYPTFQWGCASQEMLKVTADAEGSIAGVDPSPRLTTNALLHGEPATPCQLIRTDVPLARAQRDGSESAELRRNTFAYSATHRSSERWPPQRPHAFRPDSAAAELSPIRGDGGVLEAETQVLVESCVAAGVSELAPAQQHDACEPRALRSPAARHALPLLAMHPPFLTICVLGCTESELRKTVRWAAQCRLLRSPVPTSTIDLVVLGSRILIKKRYTMHPRIHSVDKETSAKAGKQQRQQRPAPHRSALSAWSSGENSGRRDHAGRDMAVIIRYWEMDSAVAWALTDVCGVPPSRMVPLKWLQDAASDAQRACEAAKFATESEEVHRSAAHAVSADGGGGSTGKCWTADATPLEELGGPLERHLAATAPSAAAETVTSTAPLQQQLFQPLPPFPPDQLPDVADPKYYIRVRRVSANSWASSASPAAVEGPREMTAGAALIGVESLKWARNREMHHSARQAMGALARQPATSSAPSPNRKEKSTGDSAPVEKDDSLTATSAFSVVSVPGGATSHAHLCAQEGTASPPMEDEQHSYEEALLTAEHRFNELVALFSVPGDGDNTRGSVGAVEHDHQRRAKALEGCYFCCVDGEYARVDWAVVRGLIRYGGGRAEKRAADEWEALLPQKQWSAAATAEITEAQKAQQEQNFVRILRRSVEYAKLRQKFLRAMRNVESACESSHRTRAGMLSGCAGPACTRGDADEENATEVARLTAKLQRVSHLCQQAPVLCLFPHSFQRAAAAERGMPGAADAAMRLRKALPGCAAVGPVPAWKRLHPLHRLLAVTMDYVLACIAVGYCLNPHSCFLFHTAIPSAPDMRLFHHQHRRRRGGGTDWQKATARHTGSRLRLGVTGSITLEESSNEAGKRPQVITTSTGNGSGGCGKATLRKPALSRWVLERRYTKTESVGVCISVLWRLPAPPATEGERCWSRVDTLSPAATAAAAECYLTPDASLVPLLRVLLLGIRNAAEALGGHVADTFSPSAVTHVVSVDVGCILSGTLRDAFTTDAVEKADAVTDTTDGRRPFPYWPAEIIERIGRCAARDEVSLVGLEWLAACVECGVFVDETAYAPPPELLVFVRAESRKSLGASAQAARRKQQRPRQSMNHCHLSQCRDSVPASPSANPTPPSSLGPHEARLLFPHEENRKRMGASTRAGSEMEALHTPPPPRLLSDGSPPDGGDKETEEHKECCTPVLRRAPTASATLCGSGVEPCTPPIRKVSLSERTAQHCRQPPPPQSLSSPVPPPPRPRSQTLSGPDLGSPSAYSRARSGGTPSAGDRICPHQHCSRSSLSASQHSTRSLRQQEDADADAERLGDLFNFFSPGSTPLPSSARPWRERSTATRADAAAGTRQRLRSSLLPRTCSQSCPRKLTPAPRAPHPRCETVIERDISSSSSASQRTQVLAPSQTEAAPRITAAETADSTVGPSNVLSTPRRRTLRGAATAAATAAHTFSASRKSTLSSPDRQRRRTEDVGVVINGSVTGFQMWTTLPGAIDTRCDVERAAPDARVPSPRLIGLPNLLGGSTELSRDDTADERAVGVSITPASCEEIDTDQRLLQGVGGTKSVWASQTPDEIGERQTQRPRGAATAAAQREWAHKRSWVGRSPQDGSHVRDEAAPGVPPLSTHVVVPWMHDVIPDSQQPQQRQKDIAVVECTYAHSIGGEVLESASFTAATIDECGSTPAAVAETAVGERYCKDAAAFVPAGEREKVLSGDDAKGASSAPDVIDATRGLPIPVPPTIAGEATVMKHKRAHPHPESCDAPRQSSPSPYPPSPSTTTVMNVSGGVSSIAKAAEEKQRCNTPCERTERSAMALSPWSRHQPLSLSRRPSGSPAPAPALVHVKPTALAAGTAAAVRGTTAAATSHTLKCLRLYVLHDLPHRASRVRRCEEALAVLMHRRDGAEPRPHIGGVQRTAESPVNDGGHGSDAYDASDLSSPTSIPQSTPPLCFVARCEDADVLVTHEINLRESVLVAIEAGCWVVRPGFLECAAAVLDGFSWSDGGTTAELIRGRRPTLQLQLQRHPTVASTAASAEAAGATASELCAVRLREALSTYEWTAEALPRSATSGYPLQSDNVPPVQRALLQQCRRQRQIREQAAVGNAGPRPAAGQLRQCAFEDSSFVLLSCSFTANAAQVGGTRTATAGGTDAERCGASSRVRAIARILETGGGHLCCCVQIGCTAADEGEKADEVHETVTTSAHAQLAVQPQLQCCLRAPSPRGQWHQLPQRSLAHTPSLRVMDAALYHDLLWLICDQIRREPSETLFVLLDASLLGIGTDGDHGGTTVYVSLASQAAADRRAASVACRDGKEADSTELLITPSPPEYGCALKKRRTEDAEMQNCTHPSPESPSRLAAVAGGDVASSHTCTVAAWLSSWLLAYSSGGRRSMAGDETPPCHRCYAPASAEAMRAHFCACCAAVRMPSSATGTYNVTDVPFAVPSLDEVRQACTDVDGRTMAGQAMPASRGAVRRIEFRSTGWVGACVAAGGSAAIATSTDAWMRACEEHTLWGALFLD